MSNHVIRVSKKVKVGDKKTALLKIVSILKEIFSKLNFDCIGPLFVSDNSNRYLLTVICISSRYLDVVALKGLFSLSYECYAPFLVIWDSRKKFKPTKGCILQQSDNRIFRAFWH